MVTLEAFMIAIVILLAIITITSCVTATVAVLYYLRLQGVNIRHLQLWIEGFRRHHDDLLRTRAWRSR